MTPETPEGRRFLEAMHGRSRPRLWAKPAPVPVETIEACDCGCGRPAGVGLAGQWLFGSRAEVERTVMLLRSAADQLWGPKP